MYSEKAEYEQWKCEKLDINVSRSEGRVTTYFVFRESCGIGIQSPLVPSPTEGTCPMVNSKTFVRSAVYAAQINTSESLSVYLFVKALV